MPQVSALYRKRKNELAKTEPLKLQQIAKEHCLLAKAHLDVLKRYNTSYHEQKLRDVDVKGFLKIDQKELSKDAQKDVDAAMAGIENVRASLRRAFGNKPLRIKIQPVYSSSTSAATTLQAPVQRCRPSDSSEFSSLAALFDEYKMFRADNHWRLYQSSGTAGGVDAAVAYDPADQSAYGALNTVLIAQQLMGPVSTGAAGASCPQPFNLTGWFNQKIEVPSGVILSATLTPATGGWVDCATTAADFGYMKYFITAPSSGTSTVEWFLVMDVEFKHRT